MFKEAANDTVFIMSSLDHHSGVSSDKDHKTQEFGRERVINISITEEEHKEENNFSLFVYKYEQFT